MKIGITAQGMTFSSLIDERFGRAKGFIIYDNNSGKINYIDNDQNLNSLQGAGIQSAKKVIQEGIKILITGNVGPKAFNALKNAGITIMTGAKGFISEAIEDFENGRLIKADNANVEGHW